MAEKKESMNISVTGHVDHGKTTLTAAQTKVQSEKGLATFKQYHQIDNAPEEKARGITIKTTHIKIETDKRVYSIVDCPGHSDYVKNMVTGASQTDASIICVAVTDGVMPQTKEHIMLLSQIGVKSCVVFLNKVDVISDPDMIELVQAEVEEVLDHYKITCYGFIKGSAKQALEGLDTPLGKPAIVELLNALDSVPTPTRNENSPFQMYIQEVFSAPGRGTVATGKVDQGQIQKNMMVSIVGLNRETVTKKVNSIEMFHTEHEKAVAGDNVGILLAGVARDSIEKGQVLCAPELVNDKNINSVFEALLYVTTPAEQGRSTAFFESYKPQFFYETANISVVEMVFGLGKTQEKIEMATPGDYLTLKITLQKPIFLQKGRGFVLRENNKTVARGTIKEIGPGIDESLYQKKTSAAAAEKAPVTKSKKG